MQKHGRSLALPLVALVLIGTTGCDDPAGPQEVHLSGRVVNTLDRPLAGATILVEVHVPERPVAVVGSATTAADGTFEVTVPKADGYAFVNCHVFQVVVEAEGYGRASASLASLISTEDCEAGRGTLAVVLEAVPRPAAPLSVLVILETLTEADELLLDLLAWGGHHVAYQLVSNVRPDQDFSGTDVVVISPEATGMGTDYRDAPVGMVVLRGALWPSYGLAASSGPGSPGTAITVTAPAHPLAAAAGLLAGDNAIFGDAGSVLWRATGPGAGAEPIAWQGTEAEHVLFTYEPGAALADADPAAARRAAFGPADLPALTPGGEHLLLTVIEWAAGAH